MRRKGVKYDNRQKLPCPKCGFDTEETKELSMSSKCLDGWMYLPFTCVLFIQLDKAYSSLIVECIKCSVLY